MTRVRGVLVAVVLVAVASGCGDDPTGPEGRGSLDDLSQDEVVAAVVERLEELDGVASAEGERATLDTDYYGVTVEARMEPDATPEDLTGALTELDLLQPRIDPGTEYDAALVVPADGVEHRLLGAHPDESRGEYADPATRTSWFEAARTALPTAVLEVGAGVQVVVADPAPAAVTEAARTVAADPVLSAVEVVEVATDGSGNYPQGLHLFSEFRLTAEVIDAWTGVLAAVGPLDAREPQDLYVTHAEDDESSPQAWTVSVHLNTLVPDDVPAGPDDGPAGRRLWSTVRGLLDVVGPLDPNAALVVTASANPFLAVTTDDSSIGYVDLRRWHRAAVQHLRP